MVVKTRQAMTKLLKLMGFIRYAGVDMSVESFEKRKQLQKTVYIAQELGVGLDYAYGWYRYGPYSTELADDGFAAFSIPPSKWDEYAEPSDMSEYKNEIASLRSIIQKVGAELPNLSMPDALELLASLLFLTRRAYPSADTMERAIERLVHCKSFTRADSKIAWNILHAHGLV